MKLEYIFFYDYVENNLFPGDIIGDDALLNDYLLFLYVILNFYLL